MTAFNPSTEMTALAEALAHVQPTLLESTIVDQRATWEASAAIEAVPDMAVVTAGALGGVPVETVTVSDAHDRAPVLHFHGGGYCIGSPGTHRGFAARLSAATGRPVVLPDYRLAPEHPYPAAVEDAMAVYAGLTEGGEVDQVVVSGDSAGGGLAVVTAVAAAGGELASPAALLCWSPWVDLTPGSLEDPQRACDPVLTAEWLGKRAQDYLAGADAAEPRASPLRGELAQLPPTLVLVGTRELLRLQAVELAKQAASSGVAVELEEVPGAVHLWMVWMPDAPESVAAIDRAAEFLRSHSGA